MALLSLNELTFAYAQPPLLECASLNIERGERIGLVGRNGAGKSTLLRLMSGELSPDDGSVVLEADATLAYLTQHVPADLSGTIFDRVAEGVRGIGTAIIDCHRLQDKQQTTPLTADEQATLDRATMAIGEVEDWDAVHRIERTLQEMDLAPDAEFSSLSAGMKRRVLLARAVVDRPDVLLLDEPTNHLDLEAIIWLQEFLLRFTGTLIFVTHDRTFLQALAKRIVEIERGRLFDWTCDYATFLRRRDAMLEAEAQQQALFDKKLAEEERWIRQGIKARRTRNEGRVRALKKLREERQARRQQVGTARMQIQGAERSGNVVVRSEGISFGYGGPPIIDNFSSTIFRGDRIGLIGPNGAGKTTLLKLLLGESTPQTGEIKFGTKMLVAYFDQLRSQLDESKSVRDNIADGADTVLINGRSKHVMGYLQDFLFSPARAQVRVSALSGGERNRLLLAKLFTKPANVLVLDEPTNDLDTETLELLEELLVDFPGTVLLVSHDRTFLNNVVTTLYVVPGGGAVHEFDGGYDDWLAQKTAAASEKLPASSSKSNAATTNGAKVGGTAARKAGTRKLSFKEQRELESLPLRIEELETKQSDLHRQMADPAFYKRNGQEIAQVKSELEKVEQELATAFQRWELLESSAE